MKNPSFLKYLIILICVLFTNPIIARCVICYTTGGYYYWPIFQGSCEDYGDLTGDPKFIGCFDVDENGGTDVNVELDDYVVSGTQVKLVLYKNGDLVAKIKPPGSTFTTYSLLNYFTLSDGQELKFIGGTDPENIIEVSENIVTIEEIFGE